MAYWKCPYCGFTASTDAERGAHLDSYPKHRDAVIEDLGL